jgi:RHS repeat-associated protein
METQNKLYYYHNDINGAPLRLTDEAGNIVWNAHYDIFGKIDKLKINEVHNPIRMQGQYEDEETGLYYNRYRYYDPNISAYVSQDPIRLRAGINLYSYVKNSFIWCDPLGLSCKKYDSKKPMSPSNYPNPDPDFNAPPVRYEPKSIEEVKRMRQGKGPTTKATHGDKNIEAHHRKQKSIENGGVMDDLEEYTHRRGGNHTRHSEVSELTPKQRAKEIREYWKQRGSEYLLPGEGI